MRRVALLLLATISIAGCTQQGPAGQVAQQGAAGAHGILGALRPKADPTMVERMHAEEQEALAKQQEAAAAQNQPMPQPQVDPAFDMNGLGRVLPKVSQDPIAPPAEEVASNGPVITPADGSAQAPFQNPVSFAPPSANPAAPAVSSAPAVATYAPSVGAVPPPPPNAQASLGGGLVPPPPAVTLSTQAQTVAGMPPGADPSSPYANPYMNPYAVPYPAAYPPPYGAYPPQYQAPPQQAMPPGPPQRPSGSPFASAGSARVSDDSADEDPKAAERARKAAAFVPITPTGMESRSAYKQRDDLKVLWKGALAGGPLSGYVQDDKFAPQLNAIDVSLPNEATKGSFSVSQRQVDAFFKMPPLDKHIYPTVRKLEGDLVQSYYRYLYAYNKFSLASQQVQARKQESDVAGSASEQQRAAADLAQAQNEADSAREDMKAAQTELGTIAGAQAARTIIGRVSGVTPSVESLNVPDQPQPVAQKSGGFFGLGGFGLGGHSGKKDVVQPPQQQQQVQQPVEAAPAKVAKGEDKKEKKSKKGKESKGGQGDLAPAPQAAQADDAAPAAAAPQSDISFELKGVNVTPRKSVLTVAIRNGGANNFSISPEVISISEGNRKLSDASIRADFDTTLVQPNQEVKGTITIFGRPWSDKLAVVLNDGSKNIALHR